MEYKKRVELTVRGVALENATQLPTLILQERERNRLLTLAIGPAEASSIIIEIEGARPPRPLTHDLLAGLFSRHRFTMKYLEIYGVAAGLELARLVYAKGARSYVMEVRPSDGVALALRLHAPIFATAEVMRDRTSGPTLFSTLDPRASEVLFIGPEDSHAASL